MATAFKLPGPVPEWSSSPRLRLVPHAQPSRKVAMVCKWVKVDGKLTAIWQRDDAR